jgi:RHS repeat-associated protein
VAFGFTGRFLDDETGLQNNLHRWYDASTGQWISEDPLGLAAGDANFYRYAGNDPVNFRDPTGLTPDFNPVDHLFDDAHVPLPDLMSNLEAQFGEQFALENPGANFRYEVTGGFLQRQFDTINFKEHRAELRRQQDLAFFHQITQPDLQARAEAEIRRAGDPLPVIVNFVGDTLQDPLVQGSLRTVEGVAQVYAAYAIAGLSGGFATPIALVIGVNGLDNATTGINILANQIGIDTGISQQTLKYQAARESGLSDAASGYAEAILNLALDLGAAYRLSLPRSTAPIAKSADDVLDIAPGGTPDDVLIAAPNRLGPEPNVIKSIKALPEGARLTSAQVSELSKNVDVILKKTLPAKASSSRGGVQDVVNLFKTDSRFRFLDQVPGARARINDALGKYGASID